MEKLVSVVIPVYNIEKYICECLDSVINQTYKNLQIILIDDGSTDGSGKICDEYAENDKRISVVHQHNQGAGAAKNTGLELIKGEYFSLIDSDDYLELNYYETMIANLEKYKVDVVQCLFNNVFKDQTIKRNFNFTADKHRTMKSKKYLFEMLYDWKYAVFWNKVFKTSLLTTNIRFPVGRKIDDEFFTYKLICNAKKILNINDVLYNYRMRQSSVMGNSKNDLLYLDRIDCFSKRLYYIKNTYPDLFSDYQVHFCNYLKEALCDKSLSIDSRNKINEILFSIELNEGSVIYKLKQKLLFRNFISDNSISNIENKEFFE